MLLSVVIPVHNTSLYVEKCVDSIVSQQLQIYDFEIILVENASSDDSYEQCLRLQDKYNMYNIVVLKTDIAGVGNARNEGLKLCKGDYVHFIDSDDYIAAGMYLEYFNIVKKYNPDFIISGIINYFENNGCKVVESPLFSEYLSDKNSVKFFLEKLDHKDKIWALNVLWNRWYKMSLIKDNNIELRVDVNLGEDFVFNCSVMTYCRCGSVVSDSFYYYMKRGTITLVNVFRDDVIYRRSIMYRSFCELYNSYNLLDSKKDFIDKIEGKLLFGSLYTIFGKSCPFSRSMKIAFLRKICLSDFFSLAIKYAKEKNSIYHRLFLWFFHYKLFIYIYILLYMRNCMMILGSRNK